MAAYVTCTQIVRPLLAALSGESWAPPRPQQIMAGFTYKKRAGRREFVRVRLTDNEGPLPIAHKHGQDGAGIITSLTQSDGLVELADALLVVNQGDILPFYPFAALV